MTECQNNEFFAGNRNRLLQRIPGNSAAVFFSADLKMRSGDSDYPFCQDENFYYFTGYEYPNACLIMVKYNDSRTKTYLFIEEFSPIMTHWHGKRPTVADIKSGTGIEDCYVSDRLPDFIPIILNRVRICFFDYSGSSPFTPLSPVQQYINNLRDQFPHVDIRRIHPLMASLRQIKDSFEIDNIREAIHLTDLGIRAILKHARGGQKEYELESLFAYEIQKRGSDLAYRPTIASGSNATILHYGSNRDTIEDGQMVLLDVGAEYNHYCADISRTLPVSGRFSEVQKRLYEVVLEANKTAIAAVKPGLTFSNITAVARQVLAGGLKRLNRIESLEDIDRYFTHNASHTIGLTVHDVVADPSAPICPGMVITVEPGLYLADLQMGIRIEDNLVVTENGHINLSEGIPKEISDIETLMEKPEG
ncbi:aminopeptidase P N-terminal domain-containing protein [bacterium]|nr:aminopeptidase P N-terminal domain-containing protein [candidate division CSSED10-310 bacterium]